MKNKQALEDNIQHAVGVESTDSANTDEQSSKRVEGLEVAEGEGRQWIEANLGPIDSAAPRAVVPHLRGEKVVQLKAPPPEEWRLL